jgi:iron complex transport system ATP-binding protein
MSAIPLVAQNLAIGYKNKDIASQIELVAKTGQLISLIGGNGIGKSTLLRTLCRLQEPISGSILLYGKPLVSYKSTELSKYISIVLTEKLPPSALTVYELIATGRQPYTNWVGILSNQDKEIIAKSIHFTNTEPLLNRKVHELSDGQLQTVLIARAVAQDTDIIIFDEPTTHLDVEHKSALFVLLKKLAQQNKVILFSTHDIEWAVEASNSIIMMTKKRTWQDSPEAFLKNNYLSELFDSSKITFDASKMKFIFNQ